MSDSINLGKLQTAFESERKAYIASERALKRAQDDRDGKKAKFEASETALKTATRTVLG